MVCSVVDCLVVCLRRLRNCSCVRLAVRGVRRQERQSTAGEGNRTLVFSLEGYCSTIELHPRWVASSGPHSPAACGRCFAGAESGECRIRTCEGRSHQIYSLTPLTARETPLFGCSALPDARHDGYSVCSLRSRAGSIKIESAVLPEMTTTRARWFVRKSGRCRATAGSGQREGLTSELAAGFEPATC